MSDARTALLKALQLHLGKSCKRSLAVTSLKLRFDNQPDENGHSYIWIEPPWRLSLAGKFITGSCDWPEWDGVEKPEVNRPIWEAWCSLSDPLDHTALVGVTVGSPLPDLSLEFESGHRIDTFGNSGDEYWWYYLNNLTNDVFEASGKGIAYERAKAANE